MSSGPGQRISRESTLARTMVELADSLVDDFDVVDLLTLLSDRCVELLGVVAAGLVLVVDGELRLMASSSEAMRVLELFELQADEGPCMDCYRTGQTLLNLDLASTEMQERWPTSPPRPLEPGSATPTLCPCDSGARSWARSTCSAPRPAT
jgi:hypothetical protein